MPPTTIIYAFFTALTEYADGTIAIHQSGVGNCHKNVN
jgi:hypothetical protein